MTGKIIFRPLLSLFLLTAATSCSLKYADTVDVDDTVPELYFTKAKITRYENDKVTVEMAADTVEQYKDSSESYAKNLSFAAYDDDNQVTTQGSCGYLFADTSKEVYELYNGIELYNHSDNTNFFAELLRWNKKTEQLTSGVNSEVRVEKDDTVMTGRGFSASGISKTFSFSGGVDGEIETSKNNKSIEEDDYKEAEE